MPYGSLQNLRLVFWLMLFRGHAYSFVVPTIQLVSYCMIKKQKEEIIPIFKPGTYYVKVCVRACVRACMCVCTYLSMFVCTYHMSKILFNGKKQLECKN